MSFFGRDEGVSLLLMDVLILKVGGHPGSDWHTIHLQDEPVRPFCVDRRRTNEEERET